MPVIRIKESTAWQGLSAFEDIASKLSWVAANSTALQVLVVELFPTLVYDNDTGKYQAARAHYKSEWVHALAKQLAACKPRLEAFGCRARDLNTFPAIPNLKHLMLDVKYVSLHDGMDSLIALKSLMTLHLKGCVSRFGESEPPWPVKCPHIELSSLTRLRRLALVDITPEGVFVSPCCAVHVHLFSSSKTIHPVWSAICIDALRSVSWFDPCCHVSIVAPSDSFKLLALKPIWL